MPESPCERCGTLCLHTENDPHPLCDHCTSVYAASRLLQDIAKGKVPPLHEEEEDPLG